jgi:hypothetical protein
MGTWNLAADRCGRMMVPLALPGEPIFPIPSPGFEVAEKCDPVSDAFS